MLCTAKAEGFLFGAMEDGSTTKESPKSEKGAWENGRDVCSAAFLQARGATKARRNMLDFETDGGL